MVGPVMSMAEALAAWDRQPNAAELAAAEAERANVLERFPLEAWPTLQLERYALGTDTSTDSFCYAMEFGTPHLGSIAGGSSRKFLIFRRRDRDEWYFDPRFQTVEEAWADTRAGFVRLFNSVAAGNIDSLGDITPADWSPAIKTKAVSLYFPGALMPIQSHAHLEHFWLLLGGQGPIESYVPGARQLLKLAQQHHEFDGWSPHEIMLFLYFWAHPREAATIVKIAPGHDGSLWPDCLENGYIRVGWDEVGDLRDYATKEEFRARFAEVFGEKYKGNQSKINEKANEVWTLIELRPGDVVLANRGTSRILGVGTVTEPGYTKRAVLDRYTHTVAVTWDTSQARDIAPMRRWAFKTVAPISEADYARIMAGQPVAPTATKLVAPPPDKIFGEIEGALRRKGQVILYGPPGTGKTYAAQRFSVWWLAKQRGDADPNMLLGDRARFAATEGTFSSAQSQRRVWWVVANPKTWNWDQLFTDGYVDYLYGRLKRNYAFLRPGDLVIGYLANPDKKIVALGRIREGLHDVDGETRFTIEPVARVANGPTYEELIAAPQLQASEPLRFRNQGTLFSLTPAEADFVLSWLAERDSNLPDLRPEESDDAGQLTRVTFHPSYTYEDFIEGFKPVPSAVGGLQLRLEDGVFKRVCRAALAAPDRPFIVLIDEINRGNIPKIFGELITLLEMDKRTLTVVLPQSREAFAIPPNVFVIGTMNTADRSIRLLDAALRRRFAFLELMPDAQLLEGGRVAGLDLAGFLAGLNLRIASIEGREKQIGHSFLLDGEQPIADPAVFAARFSTEILPLLQEYAYEDYRELASYLGSALVNVDEQRLNVDTLNDPEALVAALIEEFQPKSAIALEPELG